MHLVHVVGARPNFMKAGPVMRALNAVPGVRQTLIHTGQHYDDALSGRFFQDLDIPAPDLDLGVGPGPQAVQLGRMMVALAPVLDDIAPDWVVTVGDVNSTLAAALTASRVGLRIAHVEAGLRSGDWSMPEEVNRVLTDRLSEALFTTEPSALRNLEREGIDLTRVHPVGNVMIDTLDRHLPRARALEMWERIGVAPGRYVLATLHRPRNVDDPHRLAAWLEALGRVPAASDREVVFPIHPRTRERIDRAGLEGALAPLRILEPLGYLEFVGLLSEAAAVVTDSGGVQEEATVLGIPCLTLRPSTERPVTVEEGTNRLFDAPPGELPDAVAAASHRPRRPSRPEGWDGRAAERIAMVLREA